MVGTVRGAPMSPLIVLSLASSLAYADGGSGLGPVRGAPAPRLHSEADTVPGELDRVFTAAALEFQVPRPVLVAIGYEASHLDPDVTTRWGGWGMYDLREGDQDPALEHAAALLEIDPNRVATEWRLNVRGAAAILADQARRAHGGVLPAADDFGAWEPAIRAFSGRQEPRLQDLYVDWVYATISRGLEAQTRWGAVRIDPVWVRRGERVPTAAPPPTSPDSWTAAQFIAACSDNYSDYSRTSSDIDLIVVHVTEGSYNGTISWFQNCSAEASAHYVVSHDAGEITQMVKEADVAWHAGNWDYNTRSVGIEHEGWTADCSYGFTDAQYRASAALTADIAARQGVPLDRSHIIGHDEVPDPDGSGWGGSGHHTDPGSCWDWAYYMSLVGGSSGSAGGEIIGVVADSDIYNGARLVGATVWIAETSETTTADGTGTYRFEDVPFGTYTMHATMPGYAEGTCTKTTAGSQEWCSIALFPDDGGGEDSGGGDSGVVDTGNPDDGDSGGVDTDTGVGPNPPEEVELRLPGVPTAENAMGGCSSAPGLPAGWSILLGTVCVGTASLLGRCRRAGRV